MTSYGYATDDKVPRAGDFMTGNLSLQGTPFPLTIPTGAVLGVPAVCNDSSGNLVWSPTLAANLNFTGTVQLSGAIVVPETGQAYMGTAVLNGTTPVTVTTASVTAKSRVFLTIQVAGGTPGTPYVAAITAGTSFQVVSTSAADTSTLAWLLIDHT